MCELRHTHMCMPTAAIGRPTLDTLVQPSIDSSATHMCVCAHSSNWSAKIVECSERSRDLISNTHVCVHSRNWSANPQMISFATHACMCSQQQLVCQDFNMIKASICLFCARHVFIQKLKHTSVCPQQQLVGQPLTLGCNPQLTSSAYVCVHSSNWFAKVVECSERPRDFMIG